MKTKKLFFSMAGLAAGICLLAVAATNINNSLGLFAATQSLNYGIIMDNTNKIALGDNYGNASGTVKTNLENPVSIEISNGKKLDSGFASLDTNGYIVNTSQILGVASMNVTFTGELYLYAGGNVDTVELVGSLTSGQNVTFTDAQDYFKLVAPVQTDVTSIVVTHLCSTRFTAQDTTKRYEAENYMSQKTGLNLDDFVINDEGASGGKYVANIPQYFTFNMQVWKPIAGEYQFNVAYVSGEQYEKKICISANGVNTTYVVEEHKGWGVTPFSVGTVNINLDKGWNSVEVAFYQNSWVQFDYFEISGSEKMYDPSDLASLRTHYFKEAEDGIIGCPEGADGPQYSLWGEKFSGLNGIGLRDTQGNYVELTFENMKAGNYNLRIALGCPDGKIMTSVNGKPNVDRTITNTGGWDNVTIFTFQVTLSEGKNTIKIIRKGVWCNLDYVILDIK